MWELSLEEMKKFIEKTLYAQIETETTNVECT